MVKQHVVEMLHWQANNDKREALKKHIFNCMNKGRKQLFNIWKEALKICLLLSKALEEMTENKKSSHSLEDWNIDELKLNSQ